MCYLYENLRACLSDYRALGFLLGITTELLIEVPQVRRLIDRNNLLELENEALKENPKVVKVTEVVDGTVGSEVDYSQDW